MSTTIEIDGVTSLSCPKCGTDTITCIDGETEVEGTCYHYSCEECHATFTYYLKPYKLVIDDEEK